MTGDPKEENHMDEELEGDKVKSRIGMELLEEEDGRNELMNSVAAPAQIMLQISSA
jgi:hypothetical protein